MWIMLMGSKVKEPGYDLWPHTRRYTSGETIWTMSTNDGRITSKPLGK